MRRSNLLFGDKQFQTNVLSSQEIASLRSQRQELAGNHFPSVVFELSLFMIVVTGASGLLGA